MLQIWDRPSKSLKTLSQIHEKLSRNFKNQPENWERLMHGVQKRASDSGHTYAWGAETCLRFRAYLCTGCRNLSEIQGKSMHGVQKLASDSGHIYAWGAEIRLTFKAYFCTGCINVTQI